MKSNQSRPQAALYLRLSKDDEGADESASIKTQRDMLTAYANEHHFQIYDEYVDDGYSGTNFDRPGFIRMKKDIEAQKINIVITKDLSRLGREYITVGHYTEFYFPSKGVRYIAINDDYDSDKSNNDIAPFKNLINEMYARDTSAKIRSAFITKMKNGQFIGNFAPYGYTKDPADKNHLIIDPDTAPVVQKMFDLAENGYTPTWLAKFLNNEGVETPSVYRCKKIPHLDIDNYSERREWTASTVSKLLGNIVYTGAISQKKTTKVSFKSHTTKRNPKDEWITVDGTHEAIISKQQFEAVRIRFKSRTCSKNGSFYNVFSGIAKCADCGRNMSTVGTRKKGSQANLACGGYKIYGSSECQNHFIDYNILNSIVLNAIREKINLTDSQKAEIIAKLKAMSNMADQLEKMQAEAVKLGKQLHDSDGKIKKLYSDNYSGMITNERFAKLLNDFETENADIKKKAEIIRDKIDEIQSTETEDAQYQKFLDLIDRYSDIKELTPELLFKLIDHIDICQGHYEKGEHGIIKHQEVHIYFKFIGTPEIKEYTY